MIVTRYHDFSAAHRVVGHEGKCARLHGHNYRVHFHCKGQINELGMVIDYADIKDTLCQWIDDNWDHRTILWDQDARMFCDGVVYVPFNTTAENMAQYLIDEIGPNLLPAHVTLTKVVVEETRKCSATAEAGQ